jgi:hypothetical protein
LASQLSSVQPFPSSSSLRISECYNYKVRSVLSDRREGIFEGQSKVRSILTSSRTKNQTSVFSITALCLFSSSVDGNRFSIVYLEKWEHVEPSVLVAKKKIGGGRKRLETF